MALIHCPECGKEVSDTVKICPHCGYNVAKAEKKRNPISKKTKKTLAAGVISFIVICGVIGVLYASFSLSGSEKAQVVSLNNQISEGLQTKIENQSEEQLVTYKEEMQRITEKYSDMQWKQRRKVDDYEAVEKRLSEIDNKINSIREGKIKNVVDLINAVGDVTLESGSSIVAAKYAYEKLDDKLKNKVENYSKISAYEKKLDELYLNETINLINGIGKVSLENDSKNRIENAEVTYVCLTADSKKKVNNYSTLQAKRREYDRLERYKRLLLKAKSKIKDGYLNAAARTIKKVPSKFKYKELKASAIKRQLASKSAWASLCGRWKTTGGEMRVTQIWDYDGRSKGWHRDFYSGEESISVKCQLLNSGKVRVKIHGSIPIYTSYSDISEGLEVGSAGVTKTKTMSGMGTIRINSHTTVTLSSSGLTVNYYKVSPYEDQFFTYKYSSAMSLKKKAEKY